MQLHLTCDFNSDGKHPKSYPRATGAATSTTQHTPSDVEYNPNTGNLKFTVNGGQGFLPHSYVKIADNSSNIYMCYRCKYWTFISKIF